MPAFTTASNVRAYAGVMAINAQDDRWNAGPLGSNIQAASAFLQKRTGHQFELQTATTKTFTTNGDAYISLPCLISTTGVSLNASSLTLDTDYHLVPDSQQTGTFIGIQLRPFGNYADYRSHSDWFDRNLDRDFRRISSVPNDLVIPGDWGHNPLPAELIHVTNVLAAWFTRRPDSLLGGVSVTAAGTEVDMGALPAEVKLFIEAWKIDVEHGVASA